MKQTIEESERAIDEIYEIYQLVLCDFKERNGEKEKNYYMKCPKCGNKLQYRVSDYKNILSIRCLTEGCFIINQ